MLYISKEPQTVCPTSCHIQDTGNLPSWLQHVLPPQKNVNLFLNVLHFSGILIYIILSFLSVLLINFFRYCFQSFLIPRILFFVLNFFNSSFLSFFFPIPLPYVVISFLFLIVKFIPFFILSTFSTLNRSSLCLCMLICFDLRLCVKFITY
jgi:hypothetical protein